MLIYPMVHVGPGIASPQSCIHVVCSKVRPQGGVMELVEDGSSVLPGDTDPRVQSAVCFSFRHVHVALLLKELGMVDGNGDPKLLRVGRPGPSSSGIQPCCSCSSSCPQL